MKHLLLSASVLTLLAGVAAAADLPTYEAPMEAPAVVATPVWTGAYIGAQLGFAFQNEDDDDSCFEGTKGEEFDTDGVLDVGDGFDCSDDFSKGEVDSKGDFDDDDDDDSSFFAGAHIGYDHQIGSFVLGAVADVNFLFGDDDDDDDDDDGIDLDAIEFDSSTDEFATVDVENDIEGIDWFGTARLRAGFAVGNFLVYGTGGLAFGDGGSSSHGVTVNGDLDDNLAFAVDDDIVDPTADDECDFDDGDGTFSCEYDDDDDDDDDINVGFALGAGIDFLVSNNFKVGVEYLYVNLGDDDDDDDDGTLVEFEDGTDLFVDGAEESDNDFHTVSVRGSFKFGG